MRVATISVTGVATSNWVPLDPLTTGVSDGLFLTRGAGGTITIEFTPDDVFDSTVTPTAFTVAALTGLTANTMAALPCAARAVRLNQTVGAATSTLKVVTRGLT